MLLALAFAALADDWTPHVPEAPAPHPTECPEAADLVPGEPLPDWLLDDAGRVTCSATLVQPHVVGHLVLVEGWAFQAEARIRRERLDTQFWKDRAAYWRGIATDPTPWAQRPEQQRLFGRIDALVFVGVTAALYAAIDGAN